MNTPAIELQTALPSSDGIKPLELGNGLTSDGASADADFSVAFHASLPHSAEKTAANLDESGSQALNRQRERAQVLSGAERGSDASLKQTLSRALRTTLLDSTSQKVSATQEPEPVDKSAVEAARLSTSDLNLPETMHAWADSVPMLSRDETSIQETTQKAALDDAASLPGHGVDVATSRKTTPLYGMALGSDQIAKRKISAQDESTSHGLSSGLDASGNLQPAYFTEQLSAHGASVVSVEGSGVPPVATNVQDESLHTPSRWTSDGTKGQGDGAPNRYAATSETRSQLLLAASIEARPVAMAKVQDVSAAKPNPGGEPLPLQNSLSREATHSATRFGWGDGPGEVSLLTLPGSVALAAKPMNDTLQSGNMSAVDVSVPFQKVEQEQSESPLEQAIGAPSGFRTPGTAATAGHDPLVPSVAAQAQTQTTESVQERLLGSHVNGRDSDVAASHLHMRGAMSSLQVTSQEVPTPAGPADQQAASWLNGREQHLGQELASSQMLAHPSAQDVSRSTARDQVSLRIVDGAATDRTSGRPRPPTSQLNHREAAQASAAYTSSIDGDATPAEQSDAFVSGFHASGGHPVPIATSDASALPSPSVDSLNRATTSPQHTGYASPDAPAGVRAPETRSSSLDTGHVTTASEGGGRVLPHQTLAATPNSLEVGVQRGSEGWLKIRAEVGDRGAVTASLTATTPRGEQVLRGQLPALNAFLHSEQLAVTASVAERAGVSHGTFAWESSSSLSSSNADAEQQGFSSLQNADHSAGQHGEPTPQDGGGARSSGVEEVMGRYRGRNDDGGSGPPIVSSPGSGQRLNVRA